MSKYINKKQGLKICYFTFIFYLSADFILSFTRILSENVLLDS